MERHLPPEERKSALDSDPLLRIHEAAAILNVSRRTLEAWILDGRLPVCHLGPRSRRVLRSDLDAFIRSGRIGGEER